MAGPSTSRQPVELFGSSSEDEEKDDFKINKAYAKGYNTWRSKEEKQKLIDKYGEVEDDDSSSSDSEEIVSSKQMDKDWLRAYAVVRFQQPRLYKEGERFFHDKAKPKGKKKEKPTTLKDHERKFILEKGGRESEEEENPEPVRKGYYEEQEEIKQSFKDAVGDSSSDEEDDNLLVKRQKTKEEQVKEENEYIEWLRGEREHLEDEEAEREMAPLKAYWNDSSLPEKEKVLRDYVLNNGYMDEEESDESDDESEGPDHDVEEDFLDKADDFERKYNFRHEEPGGDEIKSYPRVIEDTVRTKDTRRVEKRQRRMEKKRSEKEVQNEEIRLLQKIHKEERQEKLRKLREISSNPELMYDLEADFDPEEHDKIMQNFFGSDYYGDAESSEKPQFEFDAAVDGDDPDDWWSERIKEDTAENEDNQDDGEEEEEYFEEGTNFNMDADYDPEEEVTNKRGKKHKTKEKNRKRLPIFDPTKKTFDEYIDEYLKDKIGTLPFTYREVLPNDFGLTTEEILTASEKELNSWVSVKKMSQYRSQQEEIADKRKFFGRSKQPGKKYKVLPSLFQTPKDKGKKKKRKREDSDSETSNAEDEFQAGPSKGKQKKLGNAVKKKTKQKTADNDSSINSEKKQKGLEPESSNVDSEKPKKKKLKTENLSDNDMQENRDQRKGKKKLKKKLVAKSVKKETSVTESVEPKPNDHENVRVRHSNTTNENSLPVSQTPKMVKVKSGSSASTLSKSSEAQDKKKKKLKKGGQQYSEQSSNSNSSMSKKSKKKKMSVSNFSKVSNSAGTGGEVNKKKLQHTLSQMMSASRLSKYGIGPDAAKGTKKRKKKKNIPKSPVS